MNNATWTWPGRRCPCGHEGTIPWGDAFAFINHGFYSYRCETCAAREQLRHAVERTLALPSLLVWFLRAKARQS